MSPNMARRPEAGSILIVTLVAAVVIAGFTFALYVVSRGETEGTKSESRRSKALQAAEAGIGEAFDRLNRGVDPAIDRSEDLRLSYRVSAENLGSTSAGNQVFRLTSQARFASADRAVEAIVENQTRQARMQAAVTSNGPVALSGSVIVDGRDHDANGFGVVGGGVFGVISSQLVVSGGNSSVGGNGTAPVDDPTELDNVFDQFVPFGDGIDQDLDGRLDEELLDGLDNEGDGRIDEDLMPFPSSPDAVFGLPEGTLAAYAQSQGTYFTSFGELSSYMSSNGNEIPGGKIIVLDFPSTPEAGPIWNPADFGDAMNADPSIFVFHTPHANAVVRNLHGRFKGLLLTDYADHVNGEAEILGGILTFGRSRVGNVYGNGNARILYSSAVLSHLPLIPYFAQKAWREIAPRD